MIDRNEIEAALRGQLRRFCQEFLGAGQEVRGQWQVGDVHNTPGKSLRIELDGPKAGRWGDFGTADVKKGSLIDLWMAVRGEPDFKTARKSLIEWLGLQDVRGPRAVREERTGGLRREVRTKEPPGAPVVDWEPIAEGSPQWEYWVQERGIDPGVLVSARVGQGSFWFREFGEKVPGTAFPAYAEDGQRLLMVKYQALERVDGKKVTRSNAGAQMHLIGQHLLGRDPGTVIIAEGESDWLSYLSAGYAALTVPFGAQADPEEGPPHRGNAWVENDWELLQRGSDWVLAYDNDEAGQAATETVLRRIGLDRCRIVVWPEEGDDGNAVFLRDPEVFVAAIEGARARDPQALRRFMDYREKIASTFWPSSEAEAGRLPPFGNFPFRFRPGEMTLWHGYNSSGKTMMQSYFLLHFASQGDRVAICSLEMPIWDTAHNLVKQGLGSVPGDRAQLDYAIDWLSDRFFIYDHVGRVSLTDVLNVFRYCAKRYGVQHFALDSLTRLTVSEEDLEGQKAVMDALVAFAVEMQVHVHLVAHSKKPSDKRSEEKHPPRKYDIRGSSTISDIAHNVLCVFRLREREMEIGRLKARPNPTLEDQARIRELEAQPSALFIVQKQRNSGEEFFRLLHFHGSSLQYLNEAADLPRRYIS